MHKFFIEIQMRIHQQPAVKSVADEMSQQPAAPLAISRKPAGMFCNRLTFSWTHYVILLSIKDPNECRFYEIEAYASELLLCGHDSLGHPIGRGEKFGGLVGNSGQAREDVEPVLITYQPDHDFNHQYPVGGGDATSMPIWMAFLSNGRA